MGGLFTAPWGYHRFYDYGQVLAWVYWLKVREQVKRPIQLRHAALYWFEIARRRKMAPGGTLEHADRVAFMSDCADLCGA